MHTPFHKVWNTELYLDAIGSAAVIAANVLIFLFVAVTAATAMTAGPAGVVDSCQTPQVAEGNYADQRPGAPRALDRDHCV